MVFRHGAQRHALAIGFMPLREGLSIMMENTRNAVWRADPAVPKQGVLWIEIILQSGKAAYPESVFRFLNRKG